MYLNAALLALLALGYALVSGRIERTWVSGPILFVLAGLALGPAGIGALSIDATLAHLRFLAEITLAMVLFADAANADVDQIRRARFLPRRLLFVGLPLTILLGLVLGLVLLPGLTLVEAALLAAALAPTDAALGRPVVSNPATPPAIRESLNFESGLNDGICVPIIVLLLGAAVSHETGGHETGRPLAHVVLTILEEIGIGVLVGAALAVPGAWALGRARAAGWIAPVWTGVPAMGLAAGCFALAQAAGGSGFIACFAGGLAFGARRADRHELLGLAEAAGEVLSLMTWVTFGALVVVQVADAITARVIAYAALSLTLARMLPVWLCLRGTRVGARDRLFIGWFGPRGLASVVFGVLILTAGLPGGETLAATIVCTVLLSVLLHGASATPLIRASAPGWAAAAARERR